MKIDIDLNCFFDGTLGYDLRSVNEYKKNLDLCQEASEKIIAETKNKSNEIINSFSRNYQEKIKLQKLKISEKKNKLVIGLGGSSAGAKAVNAYLEEGIYFFDNYDPGHLSNFLKITI